MKGPAIARVAIVGVAAAIVITVAVGAKPARSHRDHRPPANGSVSPQPTASIPPSAQGDPVAAGGPVPVAEAFARAEWTSDGRAGLHALAARTAPWASARLRSEWAAAPDPPTPPGPVATARILDARVADPRGASVVVQVDVERIWTGDGAPVVDPVPHVLLLTMAYQAGVWTVDDVAAVS